MGCGGFLNSNSSLTIIDFSILDYFVFLNLQMMASTASIFFPCQSPLHMHTCKVPSNSGMGTHAPNI